MSKEIIGLLEKAKKRLGQYQEPPVIRIGEHPLKIVYDNIDQALILSKKQLSARGLTVCKQCANWVLEECTTEVPCDMDYSAFKVKQPPALDVCKELVSFCESKERLDDDGICPTKAYELAKAVIAKEKEG